MDVSLLARFVDAFAKGIELADAKGPQAGKYSPGIGPHKEPETIGLVINEIESQGLLNVAFKREVLYPNAALHCDVLVEERNTSLYVEVKMMRKLKNNGRSEDYATSHLLSPYPDDRSALTDIDKLRNSGFAGPKAILIYGFDYDPFPSVKEGQVEAA